MKKYISILLLLCAGIQFSGTLFAQTNGIEISTEKVLVDNKAFYLHKVEPGQTLYSIANAYNVLPNEVAEENPEVFQSLPVGHHLKIPIIKGRNNTIDEIKHSDKFLFHYIEKGETLYSLSKNYGTTLEVIKKWNPKTAESMRPGEVIKIPKPDVDAALLESLLPENQEEKQGVIISHNEPGYIFHEVEKGQTLYAIEKKYGISREQIIELNPGADQVLSIGQMIKLPESVALADSSTAKVEETPSEKVDPSKLRKPESFIEHTIGKGETLYSISKKYEVSKEDIVKHNPGADAVLSIGTVVKIPVFSDEEKALNDLVHLKEVTKDTFLWEDRRYYYHKAEPKETLFSLSRFYNIKWRKIRKANPELKDRDMHIGEVVRIPKDQIKDLNEVAKRVKTKYENQREVLETKVVESPVATTLPCDTFVYDPLRDTFNVALMLPLYLYENDTMELNDSLRFEALLKEFFDDEEIDQAKFPAKPGMRIYDDSKVFLEFYEGFLLAVDSARKLGVNLNLFVYNTQNSQDTVQAILNDSAFAKMDLIVGPVFNRKIELVAEYAAKHQIPFVSPLLSPDTSSINNPFFFQVIPSLETQIRQFSDVIANYYQRNIVLMHYGTPPELVVIDLYKKHLLPMLQAKTGNDTLRFEVVELDRKKAFDILQPRKDEDDIEVIDHPIKNALIDSLPNLVIVPAKERGLVSNTLRQLNTVYEEMVSDYEITVCGFPNVQRFENIDLDYLHNLEFHTFLTSYIDYESLPVNNFIGEYRNVFLAEPSQFAFQAYDIGLYFFSMLKAKGRDFLLCMDNAQNDSLVYLQNEFSFVKKSPVGGYENSHVYVIKYDREYDIVRLDVLFRNLAKDEPKSIDHHDEIEKEEAPRKKENLRLYHPPEK